MHKRIIWTLFFAAFILDYFRSKYTSSESKTILENNQEKEEKKQININDISNKKKEKTKEKYNNEENIDEFETNQHKRKNKNIDLRIEFCQS